MMDLIVAECLSFISSDDWWRVRWEAAGFVYSDILTSEARSVAIRDQNLKNLTLDMNEDELYFVGQHIYLNVQVFINPMVSRALSLIA